MRYKVIVQLSTGVEVELGEHTLNRAIEMAKRLNEPGEWYEIVDGCTQNVVASSDAERK